MFYKNGWDCDEDEEDKIFCSSKEGRDFDEHRGSKKLSERKFFFLKTRQEFEWVFFEPKNYFKN